VNMAEEGSKKLWGGRFSEETDLLAETFNNSLDFDKRLWREDLDGSRAHVRMLAKQGILAENEVRDILGGLDRIETEIETGKFPWRPEYEDVHMNIEARLTELVGEVGGKLHTARSRNDQVATDLRLWLRRALTDALEAQHELAQTLVAEAERHLEPPLIMPGYTHLQRAQPVLLSHWFMAYYEMLSRDTTRVLDALFRMDESPLGSAALAGTSFPIDRHFVAAQLGFLGPTRNSIDAVASRDFVLEVLGAVAIGQLTLSRMAEELVLYSSFEFGFVTLPDGFATGSSIMPQKKNPDIPELIRAKTGRTTGALITMFTVVKGLPLAYNKDLQEDKEPVFDALDTYTSSLRLMKAMLPELEWHPEVMRRAAAGGFALATDLADYLARKGLPFRQAHAVVGRIVRRLQEEGRDLSDLSLEELRSFDSLFDQDALDLLSVSGSVASRNVYGGTSPEQVRARIAEAWEELEEDGS